MYGRIEWRMGCVEVCVEGWSGGTEREKRVNTVSYYL